MSIGKKLLNKMIDLKHQKGEPDSRDGMYYLSDEMEDIQIQARFKEAGKLGVLLDYLSVERKQPLLDSSEINQVLENQAEAVQEKVTFLLEHFRLIEMDRQNKRAQLRSYPPQADEDSKYYYEIMLEEGAGAHFRRYQFDRNAKRYQPISSQLTGETFERLTDELTGIIS